MRARLSIATATLLLLVLNFVSWARAAEPTFLQQAQAADLMSGLLTYYGDLTTARRDAMQSYLQHIARLQDYQANKPPALKQPQMTFADAFKGALLFVQQNGGRLADGALLRMGDNELRQEFAAIQNYNLQQFVDLNRKREEVGSMRAYLDQVGQFDGYMRWAQDNLAVSTGPGTRPTTQTAQGFADWIAQNAGSLKAKAWEQAQAKGMSKQQFEAQWQQKLLEMRQRVGGRVDAVRQLAGQLQGTVPPPAAVARPAAAPVAPAVQTPPAFAAAPTSPQDPRWQPYYYGPERQFNTWGDAYPDVYRPTPDGGVFRSYDLRLNQDYDARVNGELDRRQNTSADRRLDFRVDPKVGF